MEDTSWERGELKQVIKSACPLNCWDACGFEVTVEHGQVVKVDGDPDHPITKGKICGRGRMLEARTNSDQRLHDPLKKVDGSFVRISWQQALDEISEKLSKVEAEYGPTSVLHSHDYSSNGLLKNLDRRFFNCFGGMTEVVGSLCWGAGIEAQKWDFGNAYSHAPDDIENSESIVIWGRNVAATNMHLFTKLQQAKKNGKRIAVIDPIYNTTAKQADLYVPIRPGSDGFLALGIMKVIVEEGKQDQAFIENDSVGFSDLNALLDSFSLEEVTEATTVSRETIEELVRYYTSGPTSSFIGLGMQRYQNGGNTVRTIDALVAMSGNIGIPGGGANYANLGVGQSFSTAHLMAEERRTDIRSFTRMNQAEQILNADDPKIQLAFITRSNALTQLPDTNLARKAFESIETVVVIDQFMTDTAEIADYVLPCTTVFEEEDVYYASMYHHYVNYGPKLVKAPGKAKSDRWIWTELAKRLGFGDDFDYSAEEWLKMGLSSVEENGITLEQLRENAHALLPLDSVPWKEKQFQTPSGKYEFTSRRAELEGKDGRIRWVFPRESRNLAPERHRTYPYQLLTIHPLRSNHSQHYPLIKGIQTIRVDVSERIAEEHSLQTGDRVTVFNNRGEVQGTANVSPHLHPDVINIEEGQWSRFGGSVNVLTPREESDIGTGSTLYDCVVGIRKS